MNIIVLNAPPLSGKDEIAAGLARDYDGFVQEQVKELLFQVAVRTSGVTRVLWDSLYTRDYKERPTPYLQINGVSVSPREWMIHCSENVIKPLFGKSAFGLAAVERLHNNNHNHQTVVFSDGGFNEEIRELANYAEKTGGKFFLVRVLRKGFTWGNDSRSWLYLHQAGIHGDHAFEMDIENREGKLDECIEDIYEWYDKLAGD